jgi:hypothetical protein
MSRATRATSCAKPYRLKLPQADYEAGFRDFLRVKYRHQKFDLVIAIGDVPLEFIEKHRDTLFTNTPVVFFANRASPRRLANSSGVSAELNLSGTLALAVQLQPDLEHVFVVSGASGSNLALAEAARAQLRSFEPRLEISYLSGLPTTELERQLRSRPDHSLVYCRRGKGLSRVREGRSVNCETAVMLPIVLGHVSIDTTNVYAEVDLETKAQMLEACGSFAAGNAPIRRWRDDPSLMQFLRSL